MGKVELCLKENIEQICTILKEFAVLKSLSFFFKRHSIPASPVAVSPLCFFPLPSPKKGQSKDTRSRPTKSHPFYSFSFLVFFFFFLFSFKGALWVAAPRTSPKSSAVPLVSNGGPFQ